ncbi:hypothetical protein [Nevskia soli]|uniref:hypothetical protein n=1 Tax=Nevskia soli TaxID=418856 RepID=UPI0012F977C7|nr:hypothetical protein [Nevskia soli]
MRLKKIIQADKIVTDWGKWTFGAAMPKTAFPISKSSFKIRSTYHWRIAKFLSLGESFRLLIFYRTDKPEYGAWLGMQRDSDTQLVARYEFHGTHPGWHLHAHCQTDTAPIGRTLVDGLRIPKSGKCRRTDFSVTSDDKALYIAAEAFGLPKGDTGISIGSSSDLFGSW